MKASVIGLAAITLAMLSGCASILNDKTQPINVSATNNREITVAVDGQSVKTPAVINVTRENKNKLIVTSAEGCAKETSLEKSVDTKFFINILSGGLLGSSTDYGSEKMWRYAESVVIQCK